MDFNGFKNLMNHRKSVHPSNQKCWDFKQGECTRGQTCWYVHGEVSEESLNNFNCDVCGKVFKGRSKFMRHKKFIHKEKVPNCENFIRKKCPRTDNDCWFHHKSEEKIAFNVDEHDWPKLASSSSPKKQLGEDLVFQDVQIQAFPPDQLSKWMDMMEKLSTKVQQIDQRMKSFQI